MKHNTAHMAFSRTNQYKDLLHRVKGSFSNDDGNGNESRGEHQKKK